MDEIKLPKHWEKTRKRGNLAGTTWNMIRVLGDLMDDEWKYLEDEHGRTIKSLIRRDWIVRSPGRDLDRTRYKITGRGKKAFMVYSDDSYNDRRYDGICPECGERERVTRSSGKQAGYCRECENRLCRRKSVRTSKRVQIATCPRCKKSEKHQYPGGMFSSYCLQCTRETKQEQKRRKRKRLIKLLKNGGHVGCLKCGQRVHFTDRTVWDYCLNCYREYHRDYRKRRASEQFMNKDGES